jgi:release factor glutamine methyltransferase
MATFEQYLRGAAARLTNSETPLLDARVIAKHALGLDDAGLILAANHPLTEEERATLDALIARRARGEPVAYITGEKEFYGLNFKMAPGVLAPRPDSETLIEAATKRRAAKAQLRILDLGTGTGCLLCALLIAFPNATGLGVDINENAVDLARTNAAGLGLAARAVFRIGNWGEGLSERFDIVIANPPYIPEGAGESLPADVRNFEDPRALFAGPEGLDAYQRILAVAPRLVTPAGLTILELGTGQHHVVARFAESAFPQAHIDAEPDLAGRPRALVIDLSQQKSV